MIRGILFKFLPIALIAGMHVTATSQLHNSDTKPRNFTPEMIELNRKALSDLKLGIDAFLAEEPGYTDEIRQKRLNEAWPAIKCILKEDFK